MEEDLCCKRSAENNSQTLLADHQRPKDGSTMTENKDFPLF